MLIVENFYMTVYVIISYKNLLGLLSLSKKFIKPMGQGPNSSCFVEIVYVALSVL